MKKTINIFKIIIPLITVILMIGCGIFSHNNTQIETTNTIAKIVHMDGVILDTGKSDCIILKSRGKVIMIDTADKNDYDDIVAYLDKNMITNIDVLILTHFDKDHIGSAANIITNYNIGAIYMPNYVSDSKQYTSMIEAIDSKNVKVDRESKEVNLKLGDLNVKIDYPDKDSYVDENDYSLITEIECNGVRLLFTGDALEGRCAEFLPLITNEYNFVKLPHHGDCNDGVEALIAKSRLQYAAVTLKEEADVEEKLLFALRGYNSELFYNCNGNIRLQILEDTFEISQDPKGENN